MFDVSLTVDLKLFSNFLLNHSTIPSHWGNSALAMNSFFVKIFGSSETIKTITFTNVHLPNLLECPRWFPLAATSYFLGPMFPCNLIYTLRLLGFGLEDLNWIQNYSWYLIQSGIDDNIYSKLASVVGEWLLDAWLEASCSSIRVWASSGFVGGSNHRARWICKSTTPTMIVCTPIISKKSLSVVGYVNLSSWATSLSNWCNVSLGFLFSN